MTRVLQIAVFSAMTVAVPAAIAHAHHSGTMFDDKKQITVEGVVKEFQYTNPHSWLLVDVGLRSGRTEHVAAGEDSQKRFRARNENHDQRVPDERWTARGRMDEGGTCRRRCRVLSARTEPGNSVNRLWALGFGLVAICLRCRSA